MVCQSLNSSGRIQKIQKFLFNPIKLIMSVTMKKFMPISTSKIAYYELLKNLRKLILPLIKIQTDTSEIWKQLLMWIERKPLLRNKTQQKVAKLLKVTKSLVEVFA